MRSSPKFFNYANFYVNDVPVTPHKVAIMERVIVTANLANLTVEVTKEDPIAPIMVAILTKKSAMSSGHH